LDCLEEMEQEMKQRKNLRRKKELMRKRRRKKKSDVFESLHSKNRHMLERFPDLNKIFDSKEEDESHRR